MRARDIISDARSITGLPRVEVVLSRGAPHEEQLLSDFTRRHPRYRVIRRKSIGVALLDVSALGGRDDFLAQNTQVRRMERKARKAGYTVREFDPEAHRADLHAIHTSASSRQGRSMDESYLSESHPYKRTPGDAYLGVQREDTIVAYLHLVPAGDLAIVSRHIGHAAHLQEGVMYMLTAAAVECAKSRAPGTRFLMHDTYFGAAGGLRFFKSKSGFAPYRVRWIRDTAT